MLKKMIAGCLLVVVLALLAGGVTAQESTATSGDVRVVQIFYNTADVYIDGQLAFPGLAFTVGTDFVALEPGNHTIALAPVGAGLEASTAVDVEVVEGHVYTILTMGEFETGVPTLITIDETDTFAYADPLGNQAIIVQNVPGAVPVDVWFVDELKIENLTFGTYGTASAPLGQFAAQAVMAGQPDTVRFESQYFAVPGTVSLAYLSGTFPDKINRTFFTTTSAPLFDYLTAHVSLENSKLTILYDLLSAAGLENMLNGEVQYTLFAPTNDAFAALPEGTLATLKNDPEALMNFLGYHLVEGRWGPYELQGEHTLTSVQGASFETVFQPVEVPLTVNGVPTGLQHRTANGVIYLINSVLFPPGQ